MTRLLFVSFASALVLFGVVLLIDTGGTRATDPPTGFVTTMLVVGAVISIAGRAFEKPLDCTSDATIVVSFRSRFFIRIAFAEIPALLGFVGSLLVYNVWPYAVGFVVASFGFARLAPTRGKHSAGPRTSELERLLSIPQPRAALPVDRRT